MDLQTLSGKPVTSGNVSPPNNFRPYSPQTADRIPLQPDTAGQQFAFTASHHNVEPDASDPTATVEVACQVKPGHLDQLRESIDETTVDSPPADRGPIPGRTRPISPRRLACGRSAGGLLRQKFRQWSR
jgi:hypothetical protein